MKWINVLAIGVLFCLQSVNAANLTDVKYSATEDDNVEIVFQFSEAVEVPSSFLLQEPSPSVVIDFPGVSNQLKSHKLNVGLSAADTLTVIEAGGRTRAIVNLNYAIGEGDYRIDKMSAKHLKLVMRGKPSQLAEYSGVEYQKQEYKAQAVGNQITKVDFRRSEDGGGRVIFTLSNPNTTVNVNERGRTITAEFENTSVPRRLERKYDVVDFNTPLKAFQVMYRSGDTKINMQLQGLYQQTAYQLANEFIIEVRPLTEEEEQRRKKENMQYTGERLSLNFQDVSIRAVLQLLAEFTGLNIVTSDSVNGSITLQLTDVPWDQALDIILKTQSLGRQQFGNVILIAPVAEIAERERAEMETAQQVAEAAPLRSELIPINYAKADEMAALISSEEASLLSERGSVTVDQRTNTIWIRETIAKIDEIRDFIAKLDIPVRQVMIKARIVTVSDTIEKQLGVRFGITKEPITGTLNASNQIQQGVALEEINPFTERLNLNLPVTTLGSAGTIGVALAKLGRGVLLDLELQALESEDKAEIVASPTLVTANQQEATIEQGLEIPYQQITSSGATAVAFKKAVLSLKVTPQVTPDQSIILTLQVNQDTESDRVILGVPAIDTREIQTQVLVNNGETIVLGGIYQQDQQNRATRVPFFGDLPIVGRLFRRNETRQIRRELLIFITPTIVHEALTRVD
jgi:type IV pilus assembly protein PilQ